MKKLILFFILCISLFSFSQTEKLKIQATATVLNIVGDDAYLLTRNYGKVYLVSSEGLVQGREYIFILSVNKELKEEKHCAGCTGVLPADILEFNTSARQTAVDIGKLSKVEIEGGNDKS